MLSDSNGFGKNVTIFFADMNSFVHIDNKKKDILILGKDPTVTLDDSTVIVAKVYSINVTEQQKKFCSSLHYNWVNSNIFVNSFEIYKFKAKVI